MRLIDADAIEFHDGVIEFAAKCIIDGQPTVDAEPVVHAHWESPDMGYPGGSPSDVRCSHCGLASSQCHDRCPWCGARMDEEVH